MSKYNFKISISGEKQEAIAKAEALGELATYLDATTLKALANVVKNDPEKVAQAKAFLGV